MTLAAEATDPQQKYRLLAQAQAWNDLAEHLERLAAWNEEFQADLGRDAGPDEASAAPVAKTGSGHAIEVGSAAAARLAAEAVTATPIIVATPESAATNDEPVIAVSALIADLTVMPPKSDESGDPADPTDRLKEAVATTEIKVTENAPQGEVHPAVVALVVARHESNPAADTAEPRESLTTPLADPDGES